MAVFDSPQVSVGAKLQEKTLTSNDTYTPDLGYNGFSEVTVNVPSPQVTELPVASAEEEGNIYQYVGATQAYITNPVVTESDLAPDNPTVTIDASKLSGLTLGDSGSLTVSWEVSENNEYVAVVDNGEDTIQSDLFSTPEEAYASVGFVFSTTPAFAEVTYNSQTYTNGYFYKCTESSGSYSWVQTDVQPSSSGGVSDVIVNGTSVVSGGVATITGMLQNIATGTNALTLLGTPTANSQSINIGANSSNVSWGAVVIGYNASSQHTNGANVVIGYEARADSNATSGISIGRNAKIKGSQCITIGYDSESGASNQSCCVAIGYNAKATAGYAVQLGSGTNSTFGTLCFGTYRSARVVNYEVVSNDGTIPEARLADTTNAAQGMVLTLDSNLNAVWASGGAGGGISDVTVNGTSVVSGGVAAITCATIDDTSTTSTTATWSASKLNTTIGDIETLINAL